MGKSLLEKMGLVERVSDGREMRLPSVEDSFYSPDSEPLPEASIYGDDDVTGVNYKKEGDDFILSTYESNNLMDEEKSVFKIEKLRSTLPDTLPKDAQRDSVKKMLVAFGLDEFELVENGQLRIDALKSGLRDYMAQRSDEISDMESLIDEAKTQIQKMDAKIMEIKEITKAIDLAVEDQINCIDELCKFINPSSREEG